MRTYFAIALSCVYLSLAVGVAKTTHYCMGRVNSQSLFSFESKKCVCSLYEKDGSRSCCHDEHELIKIESDQQTTNSLQTADITPIILAYTLAGGVIDFSISFSDTSLIDREQPPPYGPPIYQKYCSLILYDEIV